MSEQRTSILGRQIARKGNLPFAEPVLIAWSATLVLALALIFVIGQNIWVLGFDLALILAVIGATFEFGQRESYAASKAKQIRDRQRRKRGEHVYVNARDENFGDPDHDPGWEFPVPLYQTKPVDLAGTGLDDMFILEHTTPGDNNYYSVIVAMQGLAEGLRGDAEWAVTSAAFGRILAGFAKRSSFVRGVALLHRSVPADMAPHENWMMRMISAAGESVRRIDEAIRSYGQLLDRNAPYVEEHRSYCVLIIPKSPTFLAEAARIARRKDAALVGGIAQVIRDETEKAQHSLERAGMGRVEVYGEQRACAVIRAFQDPTFPLDAHKGVRWNNCWPSYIGRDESVEVAGAWHTRAGVIPPRAIEPRELGPLWLGPFLTGVEPDVGDDEIAAAPTIRTVMVRMDFVEASQSREAAKKDVTRDEAKRIEESRKGKTTDGASDVAITESARRRQDLLPGSGHHGLIYSMAVSVTGRNEDDALRAGTRVEQAADNCGIGEIVWQDNRHDVAAFLTLPLGRGLAATKWTRIKTRG
ncbi:hypothetical protein [Rhodococcus sp. AQ5-07]|uniref:hypothetical protein n=1 Tax=Rhodococcus sp. AQ5-07 TaxID=2054902 RepID=UPI000DBFABDA|nr:hypothetical protein [Rhodococcus sp. AQ5-07]RAL30946.1 hypothetical protein CVN56_30500 [Rhodococcus sp. AQ5-07]